jgi:SAM-dependent methyltransferase
MGFIEKIAATVSAKNRARKYDQFLKYCDPKPADTILDIGANTEEYSPADNYLEKKYPHPEKITAIGLMDGTSFQSRYPKSAYLQADGQALPFTDNQFDIAYSNAVIEHIGSSPGQLRFLREMYRVGKRGYLTTPNRLFPIEIHTRVPFFHLFLSKRAFDSFLRIIGKDWATGDYMNLLSERELRSLLDTAHIPDYTILRNRFLGLPMTLTVIWEKHPTP